MGHATDMFYIYQLMIKMHIDIVAIRLQGLHLRIPKNPAQRITASGIFLVTVDSYLGFLVYQTPNVFLLIGVDYFYPAPEYSVNVRKTDVKTNTKIRLTYLTFNYLTIWISSDKTTSFQWME